MSFEERLTSLAIKIRQQKAAILTEEATKNAFVMPFIQSVLGYDVFNPLEVIPEFISDVGTKKGEKIDYAIMKDGEIQILIEAKKVGEPLNINHASQLFRYFHVTTARISILTNGQVYRFYTDLDAPNKMDEKPFLEFDFLDMDDHAIPELQKLTKSAFDVESVLNAAGELKYVGQIKRVMASQLNEPDDDFVRFFASRVYDGMLTQKVREQFSQLTVKAAAQFLNDQINDRLKSAMSKPSTTPVVVAEVQNDGPDAQTDTEKEDKKDKVVTTTEELEGYNIVKAIVRTEIDVKRVTPRDTLSYFGILADDNNRKPLARLHFNRSQKYLGTFDADKNETRNPIESLDDIFEYSDILRQTAQIYSDD
ncbi:type I restriction endonuclease [Pseudomonas sp. FME51]|uniref:type I restriction endonuclease n=1 Tax=Pseudomonas sp. FME51 TaxID=2742609 RepID=UPI001865BD3A|nr:type I restriction endonuclease [Pseudomonas sp. FME51]